LVSDANIMMVEATFYALKLPKLPLKAIDKDYWTSFKSKIKEIEGTTVLKIHKRIYAEGTESYAHHMTDIGRRQEMIAKLPKEYKSIDD
jgi:hypothetical protein